MSLRREFERYGEAVRVVCEPIGDRRFRVQIDDDGYELRAHRSPGGQLVFRLGERFHLATVAPAADGTLQARVDGHTWTVRKHRGRGAAGGPGGDGALTSPMTGTVLDVLVALGDRVERGQTVALVSAMKMEHKIVADVDGEVAEIGVEVGAQADQGQLLVRIEAAEQ